MKTNQLAPLFALVLAAGCATPEDIASFEQALGGQQFSVDLGAAGSSVATVRLLEASSAQAFVLWTTASPPIAPGVTRTVGAYTLSVTRDGRALTITTSYCNDFIAQVQAAVKGGYPGPAISVASPGCGAPSAWPAGATFDGHILVDLDGDGGVAEAQAAIDRVMAAAGPKAAASQIKVSTARDRWYATFTIGGHPAAVTLIADPVRWYWGTYQLGSRRIDATCRSETSEAHLE